MGKKQRKTDQVLSLAPRQRKCLDLSLLILRHTKGSYARPLCAEEHLENYYEAEGSYTQAVKILRTMHFSYATWRVPRYAAVIRSYYLAAETLL